MGHDKDQDADQSTQQLVVASDGRCIGADQSAAYEYLLALKDALAAADGGGSSHLSHHVQAHDSLSPSVCDCGCSVPRAVSAAAASTPTSPAPPAIPFFVHDAQLPCTIYSKAPRLLTTLLQSATAPAPAPPPATTRKSPPITPEQCTNCRTTKTSTWRRDPLGRLICNACKLYLKAHGASRPITQRKEVVTRRSRCGKDLARAILLQHTGSATGSSIVSPSEVPSSPATPICKTEGV